MKTTPRFSLLALLGALAAGTLFAAEAGPVTVLFEHPEKYTDLKDSFSDNDNERGRDRYLPFIREHLERAAARRLPAGQRLSVTFSDIDLAGDFEPWRGFNFDDVRIVKDIYIPRLTFAFKVTDASGQVVKSGERKLIDMSFQMGITAGFRDDPLRYEKAMIDDWLGREFPARKS